MADTTVNAPPSTPPRRPRRWPRILLGIIGVFLVLVIALYFIVSSSGFVKGVVLPRVSKSINADITVADASIHPFSEVVLHNLKVQPHGAEPLLSASEVRARYHLMDIIRGNIRVDEVAVVSPTIDYVKHADNTSNLDPITKSQRGGAAKESKKGAPSKPPQIDLKKIALSDATIRSTQLNKDGTRDVTELSHVNVTLDDLKNGQTGKLLLNADMSMQNNPPSPATNGALKAKLNGNFVFSLTGDLKPASVNGNTRLEVAQASGALSDLASLAAELNCEVTPTDVKQLALRFSKGSAKLGELRVAGPFDAEKTEGHLKVELLSIDRQVLNLAGIKNGLDFGSTTINSTNDVVLAKSGNAIILSGQLVINKFQVTRTNQTTPSLDLATKYDISVDRAAETALVRDFTLTGTQNGKPLLKGELTSPMSVAWGNVTNAVGDSALNLDVSNLNLADWKPFLGDSVSAGTVNMKMKLLSQQSGKLVTFDLDTRIDNLTAGSGSNQITQASVSLQANGKASDLKQFNLASYKAQLSRQNQPVVDLSGSGTYDLATQAADLQLLLQASLPRLLALMPNTNLTLSSGSLELKGRVTQKQSTQTVTGNLALTDLNGQFGNTDLRGFGTKVDLEMNHSPEVTQIRKATGTLSEGNNPGGNFDLSGTYQSNGVAQFTAKLAGFNQNGLRPFLEPMLADKKLVSVAVNGTATTQYDPKGDSSVKADLQVTNLVVNDPKQQVPATPLEARMQVDTALHQKVADIRQFQLSLTPTARAKNQLQLQGKVDMSQTTNYQGKIKLSSDSLDVTTYYDLFAGEKKPGAQPTPQRGRSPGAPPATAPGPAPQKEPEPMQLPFKDFTADVDIAKFFLREVEITSFLATAKINGGHVVLNPFKLALNGAPASANVDLDLGVPGYKYDTALNLQTIPLAPLVNSFAPDRKGQVGGTLNAQAKISGTGTTGASLKKTLAGQFDVNSTNLNLSVNNIKSPVLKALINVVGSVPELLRNPEAAVGTLVENVAGGGGLNEELKRSPVDSIIAKGAAGSGRVDLSQASVQSAAFRADAKGTVTLADILTNSPIQIPVSISLAHALGQKVGLVTAETPTNAAYVAMPDFYTMKGTVGDPKNEISKTALLKIAAKGILGGLSGSGKTNNLIQGLSGILGNPKPEGTNAAAQGGTNQPATNQSPVKSLLNDLLKPKKQ